MKSERLLPLGGSLDGKSLGDTPELAKGPSTEAGLPNTKAATGRTLDDECKLAVADEGTDPSQDGHQVERSRVASDCRSSISLADVSSAVGLVSHSAVSESAPEAADVDHVQSVGVVQRPEQCSAVGGLGSGVDSFRPIFDAGVVGRRLFDLIAASPSVCIDPEVLEAACRTSSRPFAGKRWLHKKHGRERKRQIEPHRTDNLLIRHAHEVATALLNPLLADLSPSVYGVPAPGRTLEHAARAHLGALYVLRIDICSYFGSLRPRHLRRALRQELGEDDERLIRLFMSARHLPQGACASPSIGNLVLVDLDRRILRVAAPSVAYTRYQDDLILSGSDRRAVIRVGAFIEDALRRMQFETKSDLMYRHTDSQLVLGYVLNSGRLSIPRSRRDGIKTAIHRLSLGLDSPVDAVPSILGRIQHLKKTNQQSARRLRERLNEVLRGKLSDKLSA